MRYLMAVLMLLCSAGLASAQPLVCTGDRCTLTFESTDPTKAHDSANDFTRLVGDRLKAQYPSQILDPRVDLSVHKQNGQTVFRFVWSARIVKALVPNADWNFDRRGTLMAAKSLQDAIVAVEQEIVDSKKVQEMRRRYSMSNIPESFVRDSYSGSNQEGWWYVKEYFLVAPK